jgi:protein subunit release factor A
MYTCLSRAQPLDDRNRRRILSELAATRKVVLRIDNRRTGRGRVWQVALESGGYRAAPATETQDASTPALVRWPCCQSLTKEAIKINPSDLRIDTTGCWRGGQHINTLPESITHLPTGTWRSARKAQPTRQQSPGAEGAIGTGP